MFLSGLWGGVRSGSRALRPQASAVAPRLARSLPILRHKGEGNRPDTRRRDFIAFIGAAAATPVLWPYAAHTQQATPVVGFLHGGSPGPFAYHAAAFRKGLGEAGFVDGKNATIDYRWVEGQYDRLPAMVADLVQHRVAVIAAGGGSRTAMAASKATATIPIVFATGADPVKLGLVATLNRPDATSPG
jgi:putative ABC transport system substrate-binding protein